jgi:hypothetical protein
MSAGRVNQRKGIRPGTADSNSFECLLHLADFSQIHCFHWTENGARELGPEPLTVEASTFAGGFAF